MEQFDRSWISAWEHIVNKEPTLPVIGEHFNNNFLLGFDGTEYVVSVREGKIADITDQITIETPWDFALRGPKKSWEKFCQETPPPMFNDIWAMAHPLHGQLRMEGNLLPLWQNLRSLNHMLDQMRRVRA
jgi:hypothetical protein